jgi:hypothetical protein
VAGTSGGLVAALLAAALGLSVALALAGPAAAAVPATPEQLAALEAAALRYVDVPGEEVVLSEARISTVASRWAAAKVAYPGLRKRWDLVFERGATQGLAIFREDAPGFWTMANAPSERCGIAVDTGIPIAAQYDLALPNCGLAGARLGDPVFIRDAGGRWTSRPRVLRFDFPGVRVQLTRLRLGRLTANAGAGVLTHALAQDRNCDPRCGRPNGRRPVILTMTGYTHCQGRLAYRRIEWFAEEVGSGEKKRSFALPCEGRD